MTFTVHQVAGVARLAAGAPPPAQRYCMPRPGTAAALRRFLVFGLRCHYAHALELAVGVAMWLWLWPRAFPRAARFEAGWVAEVLAWSLVPWALFAFWHVWTYGLAPHKAALHKHKYNPADQYAGTEGAAQLRREVTYTSLGLLHAGLAQCVYMWACATGRLAFYADPWAHPALTVCSVLAVTYWREAHFYLVHRLIHAWGWKLPLLGVDVGAWLYKHVHSLHHRSFNPGPFAGLSMHPVEHLLYYSCAWLPALLSPVALHPLVFLYARSHCDISPIGGHDGIDYPAGGGALHYLHHAAFDCNYGTALVDLDWLFGSWVSLEAYKAAGGNLRRAKDIQYGRAPWPKGSTAASGAAGAGGSPAAKGD